MSMFEPAQAAGSLPKVGLHSFKAGKLSRVEGTKKVKPDARKGLVYLQEIDELLHFYWKDRSTGIVEDDLIIFPEDAEFVKVAEARSGRVFALKFTSSAQISFYWMQDREDKDDDANVERVNALIADPKAVEPGLARSANSSGARDPFAGIDLSGAAQSMGISQDQLMEILGSDNIAQMMAANSNLLGPGRPEAGSGGDIDLQGADVMDTTGSGASNEQIPQEVEAHIASGQAPASAGQQSAIAHLNDDRQSESLRSLLAGIRVPSQQQTESEPPLELGDVLTPEIILPLLSESSIRTQLFPHLPTTLLSDPPTEAEVREIMSSVQWRQALSGLSYALNHGGSSVIQSLGIDASHAQGSSGVEALLRAVAHSLQQHGQDDGDDDAMEE